MERIFCETKKIIAVLLITLMISIIIAPISKAAYSDSMREGSKYEYRGILLITYRNKNAAKKSNIFHIKGALTRGEKITIHEKDGNILKIGNQEYIKLDVLNSGNKFKLISEEIEEPQPQPEPQPPVVEEPEIPEELIPEEEPEPEPEPQPEPQKPVEIVKVSGIELNKKQGNLYEELGWTYKLKATIKPANATNKNIKWTSDNTKVLTVDQNGKITGKSIGTATITATTEDGGFKATCKVRVTKLEINKTKLTLNIGEKSDLEIRYVEVNKTSKKKDIEWTSSNEKIAKVDANGKVTAIKEGKVTITAKAKQNKIEKYCEVTVKKVAVNKIKLNKTSATLNKGETLTLTATIDPTNATNKDVTWTSSKTSVATVSKDGKVTAKKTGEATITAKADGKTATCKITVVQLVTSIEIKSGDKSISKAELKIGETLQLKTTVTPSSASDKSVTWTTSDKSVATVSTSGKVTAKGEGTAKITVTAKDESGKKTVCTITVIDPYKYSFGGNTYRIAVKSDKLDSVMTTIKNNKISQQYGGRGRCDEIANYHIYMLLDIKKVNGKSISKYTLNEALSIGNNGGTKVSSTNSNNLLSKLKSNIDNGKPVRLHVYSGTGSHWVTVVGYRGEGTMFSNYLIISSYLGKLITGGNNDAQYILSDRDARIYN